MKPTLSRGANRLEMTPRTQRRRLQKRIKRKPLRKCATCGKRCRVRIFNRDDGYYAILKECENKECRFRVTITV